MTPHQVGQVRRFNRLYAQRLGVLDEDYLARGRPLAEARLLYEIGDGGADVKMLRQRLSLDSGYFSRLTRSLERQKLILVVNGAHDRRHKTLRLTAAGRKERAAYERLSDDLARSLAKGLSKGENERLVAALAEAERLIRKASVSIIADDPGSDAAKWCLAQYYRELDQRF